MSFSAARLASRPEPVALPRPGSAAVSHTRPAPSATTAVRRGTIHTGRKTARPDWYETMTQPKQTLAEFGWNNFFNAQLDPEALGQFPVRVTAVHRGRLQAVAPGFDSTILPFRDRSGNEEEAATVGDWLMLDAESLRPLRLLRRTSLFKRRAAGTGRRLQLIGANVDTLFIVSSCNEDFNTARLERYLALALEAGATPVVVLTKADLADDPGVYMQQALRLKPGLVVEMLDARSAEGSARLAAWCGPGQTVALVGSSGVGKSTLVNTLSGTSLAATRAVREDDAKGRHTTTGRQLHRLPHGGWLLDTPGIRELQLTDAGSGIGEVFAQVVELAQQCRFNDCSHENEPGCAIQAALKRGDLEPERLKRWRKLAAEEAFNNETLAERRARGRAFNRMARGAIAYKKARRGE